MGIAEMRKNVDTMIVVPNERLLAVVGKGMPFHEALKKADEVLLHATQGISRLITTHRHHQRRLRRRAHRHAERRLGAHGHRHRPRREPRARGGAAGHLQPAARQRLDRRRDRRAAQHHRRRRPDPRRSDQISEIVHDAVGEDAEIIFGAGNDPAMQGEIRVTVIATGFDRAARRVRPSGVHLTSPAESGRRSPRSGHAAPPRCRRLQARAAVRAPAASSGG